MAGKEFNNNVHVVIAGLTNTDSRYVTTFDENQVQRYECILRKEIVLRVLQHYAVHAHLVHTFSEFKKLASAFLSGQSVEPGPQRPDILNNQIYTTCSGLQTCWDKFW